MRAAVLVVFVCVLGCGSERLASVGEDTETGESETGGEVGEILWTRDLDIVPTVLEATPDGVLVGGWRPIWTDDPEWPDLEAEVFALDHEGSLAWSWAQNPEQPVPATIQALAWDEQGVWVGFDTVHFCTDWCPSSQLARLDHAGIELWRIELSSDVDTWEIRTIGTDAVVVGAGDGWPGAEVRRIDSTGDVIWEWVFDAEPQSVYTAGIDLFDGALWVVGQAGSDDTEPWVARLDPETGALLEIVQTQIPGRGLYSADVLPTGLAVLTEDYLWVLDGNGDWVWTRGIPSSDYYEYHFRFDARADGHFAVIGNDRVELVDARGELRWAWEPYTMDWNAVALDQSLYLATDLSWPDPDEPGDLYGRIYALRSD